MIPSLAAGAGLLGACLAIARIPNVVQSQGLFLGLFACAFLCYLVGAWWLTEDDQPRSLTIVLVVGLGARLALAPVLPTLSTDAYRYVWDAKVARAGVDPYAHPATADELVGLRDADIFPRLNHP